MLTNIMAFIVLVFGAIATAAIYDKDYPKRSVVTALLTIFIVFGLLIFTYKVYPSYSYTEYKIDDCIMYKYDCYANPFSPDACNVVEVKSICKDDIMEEFTDGKSMVRGN